MPEARADAHEHGDIVFFGRLVFEKGCDKLIRAYAGWLARGTPGLPAGRARPRLIIYGRGPELGYLEGLVRDSAWSRRRLSGVPERPGAGERGSRGVGRRCPQHLGGTRRDDSGRAVRMRCPGNRLGNGRAKGYFFEPRILVPNGDVSALIEALTTHFATGPFPVPTGTEEWSLPVIKRTLLALLDCRP